MRRVRVWGGGHTAVSFTSETFELTSLLHSDDLACLRRINQTNLPYDSRPERGVFIKSMLDQFGS